MIKNILITGASTGIGFSILEKFAEKGNNIFIVSKNKVRLNRAIDKIKRKYKKVKCYGLRCNAEDNKSPQKIIRNFYKYFDKIDVLINNVSEGDINENKNFKNIKKKFLENSFKISLNFTLNLTQLALKSMVKGNWGRVITIGSAVTQDFSGKTIYTISKISQVSLMKSLSIKNEFIKKNITFNCISPWAILTETSRWTKFKKKKPKEFKSINDKKLPLGFGKPEDVSNVVIFLSSEESRYINGVNIVVDGGATNLRQMKL